MPFKPMETNNPPKLPSHWGT